jgi:hypothetical protein
MIGATTWWVLVALSWFIHSAKGNAKCFTIHDLTFFLVYQIFWIFL